MTYRSVLAATSIVLVLATGCELVSSQSVTDPWLPAELVALALLTTWGTHVIRDASISGRLVRRLARGATTVRRDGIVYSVVPDPAFHAFVLGLARPRIWLSDGALSVLGDAELAAVLLHEEHHRRTFAPVRTLAIMAWIRTLGAIPRVRTVLEHRLALIETHADAFALRQGVTPGALARALMVAERTGPGPAFAGASDVRVRHLVAPDTCAAPGLAGLPLEWASIALIVAVVAVCHLPIA